MQGVLGIGDDDIAGDADLDAELDAWGTTSMR